MRQNPTTAAAGEWRMSDEMRLAIGQAMQAWVRTAIPGLAGKRKKMRRAVFEEFDLCTCDGCEHLHLKEHLSQSNHGGEEWHFCASCVRIHDERQHAV